MNQTENKLRCLRLGVDTLHEFIIYMHANCVICKSEGFEALTQIVVTYQTHSIIATLNIVSSDMLQINEAGLSESAWNALGVNEGDDIFVSHLIPVTSLRYVRAKIHGKVFHANELDEIIRDIVAGKYSNIHIASFITACANQNLNLEEITLLTESMINSGEKLYWNHPMIVDKHSIGGIPGNRTTPIVVAIVAAAGLLIPKISSRAITSPAGTADTVETMTPIILNEAKLRQVVEKEGGCMAWGGALGLSPADDILIRIERALDIDPEGQMIASVLSKKAAVGATHVLIDMPVGPTAKIRSDQAFLRLKEYFHLIGKSVGLIVEVLKTDGTQPLGKGIGPALEAKDILQILKLEKNAPIDLRLKAIMLAGVILELGNKVRLGQGKELAQSILDNGTALKKFLAICEAQGGFREPPTAAFSHDIIATHDGFVSEINNRNLATVAKLAGAPHDPAAGIEFCVKQGMHIEKGQLLYRIHAESKGGLAYSLDYAKSMPHIVRLVRF